MKTSSSELISLKPGDLLITKYQHPAERYSWHERYIEKKTSDVGDLYLDLDKDKILTFLHFVEDDVIYKPDHFTSRCLIVLFDNQKLVYAINSSYLNIYQQK